MHSKTSNFGRMEVLQKMSWDSCVPNIDQKTQIEDFWLITMKFLLYIALTLFIKQNSKTNAWTLSSGVCSSSTSSNSHPRWNFDWIRSVTIHEPYKTLSQTKYSNAIFVHRKSSGKLWNFIHWRSRNHLLPNKYKKKFHFRIGQKSQIISQLKICFIK